MCLILAGGSGIGQWYKDFSAKVEFQDEEWRQHMKYQLVLQFKETDLGYDDMIALEDALIAVLEGSAEVDGHDAGSGEINFFVLTDDPMACFEKAKASLVTHSNHDFKAAYREVAGDKYTIVWPHGLKEFAVA
jgi:hypothetical protein